MKPKASNNPPPPADSVPKVSIVSGGASKIDNIKEQIRQEKLQKQQASLPQEPRKHKRIIPPSVIIKQRKPKKYSDQDWEFFGNQQTSQRRALSNQDLAYYEDLFKHYYQEMKSRSTYQFIYLSVICLLIIFLAFLRIKIKKFLDKWYSQSLRSIAIDSLY